jgi:hypothetical protein
MRHACVAVLGLGLAAGTLWSVTVDAQTRAGGAYVVPRTPWGDPDLQGDFTNLFEAGTPLERPAQFDGRRPEDITKTELDAFKAQVRERTIANFEGPIHAPDHWWQASYDPVKGQNPWLVIEPADGKIPALTADAQRRAAARDAARKANTRGPADSWTDRTLSDRCITRGLPGSMMPGIYGNSYQIVQGPGFVAITYEMIHETRVIPLAHKPHVAKGVRLDMGDARGRWEGDTLVVETTNFMERSVFRNANPETLKLVERFTRTARDTVHWQVTVDDPSTWTKPWTFAMPLTQGGTETLMQYECHEGNYGLLNILSAARAAEREAAAGTAAPAK